MFGRKDLGRGILAEQRVAERNRRRVLRTLAPELDDLETRVVLHRGFGGPGMLGGMMVPGEFAPPQFAAGVRSVQPVFNPALAHRGGGFRRGPIVQDAQLTADIEKLRTDTAAMIAGSTVTDAQRQALGNDLRSLAKAGVRPDRTALAAVGESLLAAIADGSYDSDTTKADSIKIAFTNTFTASAIDQTLIDQTFTDLVIVARGLNISTDELNTLAADRAAIQADLTRLGLDTTTGPRQGSLADLIFAPGRAPFRGRRS